MTEKDGTHPGLHKIYLAGLVHSISLVELEYSEFSAVCVSQEGVIEWVEHLDIAWKGDEDDTALDELLRLHGLNRRDVEVFRLKEGFLCPGLVDTHTHAPQYPNNGLGSDLQLLDWLEQVTFPTEAKFTDLKYAREVYEKVVRRTLDAGTTTSCYYATIHEDSSKLLADICNDLGQRAFIGKCCMDRESPSNYVETTESSIASTESFLSHFPPSPSALVQPILTPRFAISCSSSLLTALGRIAASRSPSMAIQTHMSENRLECDLVKRLFENEARGEEWGKTYAGIYEKYGLLGPGTILAHCVQLDEAEREVIQRSGAGVSHCPASNLFLSSGCARIRELLDMGIKVGLGTDCSGGPSIGILSAIRTASHISKFLSFPLADGLLPLRSRPLSTAELFYLATKGGASLCRLEDRIGSFLPGKEFDALWVRPRSPGSFAEGREGVRSVFEKWIWAGDDRDIGRVWVKGRCVGGAEIWEETATRPWDSQAE